MRTLRTLLLLVPICLAALGCGVARPAVYHKPPPDPLVSSSKKPVVNVPTSGEPCCRTKSFPAPPPIPNMNP